MLFRCSDAEPAPSRGGHHGGKSGPPPEIQAALDAAPKPKRAAPRRTKSAKQALDFVDAGARRSARVPKPSYKRMYAAAAQVWGKHLDHTLTLKAHRHVLEKKSPPATCSERSVRLRYL